MRSANVCAVSAVREAIRLRPSSSEAYNELGLALSDEADRQSDIGLIVQCSI